MRLRRLKYSEWTPVGQPVLVPALQNVPQDSTNTVRGNHWLLAVQALFCFVLVDKGVEHLAEHIVLRFVAGMSRWQQGRQVVSHKQSGLTHAR